MDMDLGDKFDVVNEKKLPIIYIQKANNFNEDSGMKIRTLRLQSNLTIKELSKLTGINSTTLMHIEHNKIKTPYYYFHLICKVLNTDHIKYLELHNLPEKTIKDKLWKIRILIGANSWEGTGDFLGFKKSKVIEWLNRRKENNKMHEFLSQKIKELI
jgi:transcriptional regulator with XRE-family HTH domain